MPHDQVDQLMRFLKTALLTEEVQEILKRQLLAFLSGQAGPASAGRPPGRWELVKSAAHITGVDKQDIYNMIGLGALQRRQQLPGAKRKTEVDIDQILALLDRGVLRRQPQPAPVPLKPAHAAGGAPSQPHAFHPLSTPTTPPHPPAVAPHGAAHLPPQAPQGYSPPGVNGVSATYGSGPGGPMYPPGYGPAR